jgi:hypothetical protein
MNSPKSKLVQALIDDIKTIQFSSSLPHHRAVDYLDGTEDARRAVLDILAWALLQSNLE